MNNKRKNFVGIQVGIISFIDEGVPQVLDFLQEKASVNAILASTLSWSRGNAGRALDWFPDHGVAEPDNLQGGSFVDIHEQYYAHTKIRDFRASDPLTQGYDYLQMLLPETKKRGIKVYPYYCETSRPNPKSLNIPGFIHVLEVDAWGRRTGRPCVNNPDYRAWILSIMEDYVKSYDIDGICWGVERKGPLFTSIDGEPPTCFCPHCRQAAHEWGIDVERARQGYLVMYDFLSRARKGERPSDGYLVQFFRVLFNHPEILAWEKLWREGHKSLYHEIYGTVKWLNPAKEVGIHIWQFINTYDPFLRAQYDLAEFKQCADWLKPVVYNEVAGARFAKIVQDWTKTYLGDFTPEEATQFLYKVLLLDQAPWSRLVEAGFTPEYVFNEIARTVRAVGPQVKVYPGLGVGVQGVPADAKPITPESIKASVRAAYEAGASGIVISRNYSEATLANIAAVGDALRELGIDEYIPAGLSEVQLGTNEGQEQETDQATDRGF